MPPVSTTPLPQRTGESSAWLRRGIPVRHADPACPVLAPETDPADLVEVSLDQVELLDPCPCALLPGPPPLEHALAALGRSFSLQAAANLKVLALRAGDRATIQGIEALAAPLLPGLLARATLIEILVSRKPDHPVGRVLFDAIAEIHAAAGLISSRYPRLLTQGVGERFREFLDLEVFTSQERNPLPDWNLDACIDAFRTELAFEGHTDFPVIAAELALLRAALITSTHLSTQEPDRVVLIDRLDTSFARSNAQALALATGTCHDLGEGWAALRLPAAFITLAQDMHSPRAFLLLGPADPAADWTQAAALALSIWQDASERSADSSMTLEDAWPVALAAVAAAPSSSLNEDELDVPA